MEFHGKVYRWRRPTSPDPYNPDRERTGEWHEAEQVELVGAWVASTSSYALRSEGRVQVLTAKSLFLDDPFADVQYGDGISTSPGGDMPEFIVDAAPRADENPFTGWQPVREVPLRGATG